jgi:N-acetylglucosaminyl-diphospho-decaprenol L-rhamnosyltransferase
VSPARDLSVIIVSHGHEALLPACLGSLGPALAGLAAEILLVDNLPRGGLGPALADVTVPVRVFENSHPQGLSANVNLAAAHSIAAHLLILNPDTVHRAGTLAEALRFMAAHPQVGMLGCTLLNPDGTAQQSFRRFPNPAFLLARALGADHWPWQPEFYRRGLMQDERGDGPHEVDWVFGAAMLLRRSVFDTLGGMDERYRLYYEDVDLAWRLRRAGLRTWVFTGLCFVHAHQRTSARRPFSRARWWHLCSAARFLWQARLGVAEPGQIPRSTPGQP